MIAPDLAIKLRRRLESVTGKLVEADAVDESRAVEIPMHVLVRPTVMVGTDNEISRPLRMGFHRGETMQRKDVKWHPD